MPIRKVAYIDHSYHIHTASTQFVVDALRTRFEVDVHWDDSWQGGDAVSPKTINDSGVEAVVFFQILYEPEVLKQFCCKNIVFIPMYDGSGLLPDEYWLERRHIKFLNFSSWLHHRLCEFGLVSHYIQYYSDPEKVAHRAAPAHQEPLRGFFWQRMDHITWNHIRTLIEGTEFSHIHLHTATDPPGYDVVQPSPEETKQHHITVSDWFEKPGEYLEKVAAADVYFAPRVGEGIGLSFLEAMAMGKCVVCPDYPTMNEYVRHEENGLVYDFTNPQPLDFSRAHELGQAAAESARTGYENWLQRRQEINDFVEQSAPKLPLRALLKQMRLRGLEILHRYPRLDRLVYRLTSPLRESP